jgi:RNA polymerase sigma-70 factor (ECF subfamily)
MAVSPTARLGDEELVALVQKGDRRAFEELVERHKQKAYRIAFDFARDREEAKDLSQEAFLKAFTHIGRFDGRSGFYTWFYRILVNVCLDYRRRAKRTSTEEFNETVEGRIEPSPLVSNPVSPDQHAIAGQLSRRVGAALELLPPKQRTAFILKIIRDYRLGDRRDDGNRRGHGQGAPASRGDGLRQSLAEFA